MPILTCIFFTNNWLTLTSEMHFVKFHPEVASCLLSRGKRKYAPLGMRLIWKYIRNYFLVYQLISHFSSYLQNYKEFKAKILDLQPEKYGLSFDIKKCTTSGWALGVENVIGMRAFKDTKTIIIAKHIINKKLITRRLISLTSISTKHNKPFKSIQSYTLYACTHPHTPPHTHTPYTHTPTNKPLSLISNTINHNINEHKIIEVTG